MKRPNIIIDASHTYGSGKNTGIERVVRNLCRNLPEVLFRRGLDSPAIATHFQGRFLQIDHSLENRLQFLADWERNAGQFVPGWVQAIPNSIAKLSGSAKIRKWMQPQPSHLGIYKLPHHLVRWSTLLGSVLKDKTIAPGPNQILILPDAYWTRRGIWKTVETHRKAGAFVATVVYDLIPLTHPEYVGAKRSLKFQSYLDQVLRHSDAIIAISKSVRDDVKKYIDSQSDPHGLCNDVRSFVLGAELAIPNQTLQDHTVRPIVESLFDPASKNTPYFMVASFDPRKNHQQALDAFDLLWKKYPDLNLCFAGRRGSMCADLMKRIDSHPKLHRGLWVFHDLSDIELHHAYERCSAVLLPSIVEGFGLPIVESLWHGRKTFASDTPIHREVGGEHCEYFALHDPQDLAQRIENWERAIRSVDSRTSAHTLAWNLNAERFVPTTWAESTSELIDAVLDAYQSSPFRQPGPLTTPALPSLRSMPSAT